MEKKNQTQDALSSSVIGAAIEVHKVLGPGLLESAYQSALEAEFEHQQISFESQVPVPVTYRDRRLDCGYRLDLIIDNQLIVEIKAVEAFLPVHQAQLLTYLKLTGIRTGLLLNFNSVLLRDGIKRLRL